MELSSIDLCYFTVPLYKLSKFERDFNNDVEFLDDEYSFNCTTGRCDTIIIETETERENIVLVDKKLLKRSILFNNEFQICKAALAASNNDLYLALNCYLTAIRYLFYGLEIATFGSICNFDGVNYIRDEIMQKKYTFKKFSDVLGFCLPYFYHYLYLFLCCVPDFVFPSSKICNKLLSHKSKSRKMCLITIKMMFLKELILKICFAMSKKLKFRKEIQNEIVSKLLENLFEIFILGKNEECGCGFFCGHYGYGCLGKKRKDFFNEDFPEYLGKNEELLSGQEIEEVLYNEDFPEYTDSFPTKRIFKEDIKEKGHYHGAKLKGFPCFKYNEDFPEYTDSFKTKEKIIVGEEIEEKLKGFPTKKIFKKNIKKKGAKLEGFLCFKYNEDLAKYTYFLTKEKIIVEEKLKGFLYFIVENIECEREGLRNWKLVHKKTGLRSCISTKVKCFYSMFSDEIQNEQKFWEEEFKWFSEFMEVKEPRFKAFVRKNKKERSKLKHLKKKKMK